MRQETATLADGCSALLPPTTHSGRRSASGSTYFSIPHFFEVCKNNLSIDESHDGLAWPKSCPFPRGSKAIQEGASTTAGRHVCVILFSGTKSLVKSQDRLRLQHFSRCLPTCSKADEVFDLSCQRLNEADLIEWIKEVGHNFAIDMGSDIF